MGSFFYKNKFYEYDDAIYMKQVDSEYLILTRPYHFDGIIVPAHFIWNGASSPNTPIARWIAPKFYRNIKASCVHDFSCSTAKCAADRHKADINYFLMKKFVEKDQELKCLLSLWGVEIGAKLGIGSKF
jgi:hypothetical protein